MRAERCELGDVSRGVRHDVDHLVQVEHRLLKLPHGPAREIRGEDYHAAGIMDEGRKAVERPLGHSIVDGAVHVGERVHEVLAVVLVVGIAREEASVARPFPGIGLEIREIVEADGLAEAPDARS